MQTFLPYPDFKKSLQCLDTKRLGKQRVESIQILNALAGKTKGWSNHPATNMWRGYELALKEYYNISLDVWEERGYRNLKLYHWDIPDRSKIILPDWVGMDTFHLSHQSNLLRKNPTYYSKYNWNVPDNLPYVWP